MSVYEKEDIMRLVEEEDVEFIRLQFTDILGTMKNIAITSSQLEKALDNRFMFDGTSIEGYVRKGEADMYLYPDKDTMEIFPWRPQQGKVARMICDVHMPDRNPFQGDSRQILKKVLKEAEKMGYQFQVGPECEFFLFNTDDNGMPTTRVNEQAGYFDIGPVDNGENVRRDIVLTLEDMGVVVEASHHESAPGQHEVDFESADALTTADRLMTFKMVAKTMAKRHGYWATFMPKPVEGVHGSGMHFNMSLEKDGKNIFRNEDGEYGLSEEALYFIGGLLKHMKGITAITNPLVNSYKRLVPNYYAPVYADWGKSCYNPLIRVPESASEPVRLELRSPDPSANPYLAFAVCLAAGLDGIKNKIRPPKAVSMDAADMQENQRESLGIESLPMNLKGALEALKEDELLKKTLGEHIFERFVKVKEKEWAEYSSAISTWEVQRYLYKV